MNDYTLMRVTLPLSPEEVDALRGMAKRDCRRPRDQVRYLLRQALGLTDGTAQEKTDRGAQGLEAQRAAA